MFVCRINYYSSMCQVAGILFRCSACYPTHQSAQITVRMLTIALVRTPPLVVSSLMQPLEFWPRQASWNMVRLRWQLDEVKLGIIDTTAPAMTTTAPRTYERKAQSTMELQVSGLFAHVAQEMSRWTLTSAPSTWHTHQLRKYQTSRIHWLTGTHLIIEVYLLSSWLGEI